MIPVKITTHEEDAPELLTEQFKEKQVTEAIVRIQARRMQKIENAIYDVLEGRLLSNAVGVWLDYCGAIVKEPRDGRQDEIYRHAIRVRVRVNRSKGRSIDVQDVATLLDSSATYVEAFPLGWEVSIYNTDQGGSFIKSLSQTKMATSYGVLVTSNWEESTGMWTYP